MCSQNVVNAESCAFSRLPLPDPLCPRGWIQRPALANRFLKASAEDRPFFQKTPNRAAKRNSSSERQRPSSPLFLERPGLDFEAPRGSILFDKVGGDRGDAGGIDVKIVRAVAEPRACHRPADDAVDD